MTGPQATPSGQVACLSGTQNVLTTVTANISPLTVAVGSGMYKILADLVYTMDANSSGIYFGLAFPAIRKADIQLIGQGAAAVTLGLTQIRVDAQGAGSTSLLQITSGTVARMILRVEGVMHVTAPGNINFNARTEVANTTARIWDNSNIIVWYVGDAHGA